MSSADKHKYDQQLLTQYLLGALSEVDTERVDEWSVTDDQFAESLEAVENDLVDAYVRGELSGDTLDRFKRFYLSSPRRVEKVQISRALWRYEDSVARAPALAAAPRAIPGSEVSQQSPTLWFPWRRFQLPRWGPAGAASLGLFVAGYLFVENRRLQRQGTEAQERQETLARFTQELERQLGEQRSANAGLVQELDHLREALAEPHALKIVAALLLPQTRGTGQASTVFVSGGADQVQLRLRLEVDDFPAYRVALKDPLLNRVILNRSGLKARSEAEGRVVSIRVPADLLKKQDYTVELTGVDTRGTQESLSSYFFKVVK
jgi:hypothetical protein